LLGTETTVVTDAESISLTLIKFGPVSGTAMSSVPEIGPTGDEFTGGMFTPTFTVPSEIASLLALVGSGPSGTAPSFTRVVTGLPLTTAVFTRLIGVGPVAAVGLIVALIT